MIKKISKYYKLLFLYFRFCTNCLDIWNLICFLMAILFSVCRHVWDSENSRQVITWNDRQHSLIQHFKNQDLLLLLFFNLHALWNLLMRKLIVLLLISLGSVVHFMFLSKLVLKNKSKWPLQTFISGRCLLISMCIECCFNFKYYNTIKT